MFSGRNVQIWNWRQTLCATNLGGGGGTGSKVFEIRAFNTVRKSGSVSVLYKDINAFTVLLIYVCSLSPVGLSDEKCHDSSRGLSQLQPADLSTEGRWRRDSGSAFQPVPEFVADIAAAGKYVWSGRSQLQQVQDCMQRFSMSALSTGENRVCQHCLQVRTEYVSAVYRWEQHSITSCCLKLKIQHTTKQRNIVSGLYLEVLLRSWTHVMNLLATS
jgi:hypothetical protein